MEPRLGPNIHPSTGLLTDCHHCARIVVDVSNLPGKALTYSGMEVIDGRSIASDYSLFPKGALAYLEFEKPVFSRGHREPKAWQKTSRLVFDHDTGGAIRGPGHIDLFWGSGKDAEIHAGVMKNYGRLFYLIPKSVLPSD